MNSGTYQFAKKCWLKQQLKNIFLKCISTAKGGSGRVGSKPVD